MNAISGIPYRFEDPGLLALALTHRSLGQPNNERLEFLGDSILNFVVAERLFELNADNDEGELSRLRARVVRGETLARIAAGLDLSEHVRMDQGSLNTGVFRLASTQADLLEAIIGAIYLDGGFEICRRVILHLCEDIIRALPSAEELKDPKTRLQEWMQGRGYPLPEYRLESEQGPAHERVFRVRCLSPVTGIDAIGVGSSRQKAEQAAAGAALEGIGGVPSS